jgi:hypothetical protein
MSAETMQVGGLLELPICFVRSANSPRAISIALLCRMKFALSSLAFLMILSFARGAEADSAAVLRAEERRIRATITRNAEELRELLSDDLHYAHADGRVQTKAQLIAALSTADLKHLSVTPEGVKVQPIADGAATLSGQTRILVEASGRRVAFALRFLSVWRREAGQWRLVAYQSSQLSPPAAATN